MTVSRKQSADEFDEPWPLQEPREVLSNRKLRFPSMAQEYLVGFEDGVAVHWNYDVDSGFVFVSQAPAYKEGYTYADRNVVEEPMSEWPKIRAPAALPAQIRERFEIEGTYMVYLASPEMLTDENPSAWVLSWSQFTSLLPGAGGTGPDDVSTAISKNPGFMPSSPF
ncbi:hypothetical protein ACOZ4B_14340 [Haloferax prahovense]|uniref:hypothetical protein n=1 Tax=Haloferax prahovense TaxID=381852 RepID=UPI003C75FF2D